MASRAAEQLADARARRARPGDALGPGLAAGDRPRAVRRAAHQARADRRQPRRRSRRWSTRRSPRRSSRPAARPSSTSRSTRSSWRPTAPEPARRRCPTPPALPRGRRVAAAAELLRGAERPVVMAGTGLYWGHGEDALPALGEELRIPVFLNGLARGCVPADHELLLLARAQHRRSRAPTSRSWSACRWTSAWASAAPSARTRRSS